MPTNSHLLDLPAELRNTIYRFALVDYQRITLHSTTTMEPPLLSTCHQIRNEASSIYWAENTFVIPIYHCNSDPLIKFSRKIRALYNAYRVMPKVALNALPSPNWSNFLVWLKRIHARKVCGSFPAPVVVEPGKGGGAVEQQMLHAMAEMVKGLRSVEWETCERFVELQHGALVGANAAWK